VVLEVRAWRAMVLAQSSAFSSFACRAVWLSLPQFVISWQAVIWLAEHILALVVILYGASLLFQWFSAFGKAFRREWGADGAGREIRRQLRRARWKDAWQTYWFPLGVGIGTVALIFAVVGCFVKG
jgi:hypothetical protein